MEPNTFSFELRPKGEFLLQLEDGQYVKGRFSMYALDRFAEHYKLDTYFRLMAKISMGMGIKDYCRLILFAIEDYYRQDVEQCCLTVQLEEGSLPVKKRWTVDLVNDLILENLELGNEKSKQFFSHAIGRIAKITDEEKEEGEEKKNLKQNPLTGGNTDASAIQPV